MPETTEHRVSASTVIGGIHPDAVHISAHADGSIGIHIDAGWTHISLFGTLDDLVAVTTKLGRELAKIAASRVPVASTDRPGHSAVFTNADDFLADLDDGATS